MNVSRPKNLNLFTIRFPIPAILSILHRASGVFLILLIPFVLWLLHFSLSEEGFVTIKNWWSSNLIKSIFLILFFPFLFHLIAGLRHLLADIHLGDTLPAGRISAWLTFIISFIALLFFGLWSW